MAQWNNIHASAEVCARVRSAPSLSLPSLFINFKLKLIQVLSLPSCPTSFPDLWDVIGTPSPVEDYAYEIHTQAKNTPANRKKAKKESFPYPSKYLAVTLPNEIKREENKKNRVDFDF